MGIGSGNLDENGNDVERNPGIGMLTCEILCERVVSETRLSDYATQVR